MTNTLPQLAKELRSTAAMWRRGEIVCDPAILERAADAIELAYPPMTPLEFGMQTLRMFSKKHRK